MAYVEMDATAATKLDRVGHIRIGWVNCRVRLKVRIVRCYRCHGYGHIAAECKANDRRDLCWKCGREGHKAAQCPNAPKCYLCAEIDDGNSVDHIPGSARCTAYAKAGKKSTARRWR